MESSRFVSFKVYLIENGSEANEIRRFGCEVFDASRYANFIKTVTEVFPGLSKKQFSIYWMDDDGDHVAVSSDAEFLIALTSMQGNVKKFYVRVESAGGEAQVHAEPENSVPHPGVYCDGCNSDIAGTRYKCLKCRDYDLCRGCEQAGIHSEHPMIKIPHPMCFDRLSLHKLTEFIRATIPLTIIRHHRRQHAHENGHADSHKKKKRSDRRESGPDTGDEMDEACHKKHSHKKCRKQSSCPYSQMANYFSPLSFQAIRDWCDEAGKKTEEESGSHLAYLKTVGSTIQKLLDPLGVNVEFEVRANEDKREEKKQEEKAKEKEEEKKAEAEKPGPSAPPQKEVRFASPQTVKQGIEEITKSLANQKMSSSSSDNSRTSPENDGWVSFEELKRETEEPQAACSGESTAKESGPRGPEKPAQASAPHQEAPNLYPDLSDQHVSEEVKEAVKQMLSMGFTNQGHWLTHLLEAKKGNIDQVLELLSPCKRK